MSKEQEQIDAIKSIIKANRNHFQKVINTDENYKLIVLCTAYLKVDNDKFEIIKELLK